MQQSITENEDSVLIPTPEDPQYSVSMGASASLESSQSEDSSRAGQEENIDTTKANLESTLEGSNFNVSNKSNDFGLEVSANNESGYRKNDSESSDFIIDVECCDDEFLLWKAKIIS